jgi:hypothetical protein
MNPTPTEPPISGFVGSDIHGKKKKKRRRKKRMEMV